MIKSVPYVTRLYQGNQTLPNTQYHEFGSATIEETKNDTTEQSSRSEECGDGKQNRSECEKVVENT